MENLCALKARRYVITCRPQYHCTTMLIILLLYKWLHHQNSV